MGKIMRRVICLFTVLVSMMALFSGCCLSNERDAVLTNEEQRSEEIDEEQRIDEIKEEALIHAREYIRQALIEESVCTDETISSLDNIEVTYGLEELEGKTYTVTATYKYHLELDLVYMDIYYVCEITGNLRNKDVTVTLLDYYTSDPEIKVDPKQLYTSFCSGQWATYESDENYDRIVIDTNPNDDRIANDPTARFIDSGKWYIEDVDIAIQSINNALNLPPELRDRIVTATHVNPGQAEVFAGYIGYSSLRVSYAFHPNKGLRVTYEFSK